MTASFTQPFNLTVGSGAVGPTASSSFLTADFTANPSTGAQTIVNTVWGTGMSVVGLFNWQAFSDSTFQAQCKQIPLPLYRLNALSSVVGDFGSPLFLEATFAADGSLLTWQYVDQFIDTFPLCFNNFVGNPPKIILGLGFDPTTWNTSTIYGTVVGQVANRFKTRVSAATGALVPIYGWEVGNEQQNLTPATYQDYFNHAADAYHSVDANYIVVGPVFNFLDQSAYASFIAACGSRCGAICYHGYKFGANQNPGDAAIIDMTVNPGQFRANADATNCRTVISNAGRSTQIFMGEWAMDDTSSFSADPQMQTYLSAVFNAQWMLDAIRANVGVTLGAYWELFQNSEYGLIQGEGAQAGGIAPSGFLMSKAASTMFGTRVSDNSVKLNDSGQLLNILSVKDVTSTTRFAVMLVNYSTTTSYTGQIALSHWPLNSSGNATISRWEISSANPTGVTTALNVNVGLTTAITLPAASVTILTP